MTQSPRNYFLFLLTFVWFGLPISWAQSHSEPVVYLIPGTGGDYRLYDQLEVHGYDTVRLAWLEPEPHYQMADMAAAMAQQIDTTRPVVLVGVSLGGMVASEMAELIPVDGLILISSAKTSQELPFRYRFQKAIPLYRLIPGSVMRDATPLARFFVEPQSFPYRKTFDAMVAEKSDNFMKQSIRMICQWEKGSEPKVPFLQLHGTRDHTLPYRKIAAPTPIPKGSHMMVYVRGEEVGQAMQLWLDQQYSR
ncbi:MAG: alpha/beta hydrolase [Bacteroidota bacterium]